LNEFSCRHPAAKTPLDAWYQIVSKTEFHDLMGIRRIYPATDDVHGLLVFNIGGNKFRLIVKPEFRWQKFFIVDVLTHSVYDAGTWKKTSGTKRGAA